MFGGTNDNFDEIKKLDTKAVAGLKLFLDHLRNMLVDDEAVLRKIFSSTDLVISVHCEDEPTIKKNLAEHIEKYGDDIPIEHHPIIRSHEACYLSSRHCIGQRNGCAFTCFSFIYRKRNIVIRQYHTPRRKKITAEVCVHHLWFSADDYAKKGTHIKWNPAVKNAEDAALWNALNDDRIDVLATDHAHNG